MKGDGGRRSEDRMSPPISHFIPTSPYSYCPAVGSAFWEVNRYAPARLRSAVRPTGWPANSAMASITQVHWYSADALSPIM